MCSQASQLLAEIPFIVQPTAWLRGLLSPRNRDALGETGLRPMPQTENASCPVKPTGSGWLSVQGCLSVSLKGPFGAEGGKTNLEFQC